MYPVVSNILCLMLRYFSSLKLILNVKLRHTTMYSHGGDAWILLISKNGNAESVYNSLMSVQPTDLNYWIKLLSCIIEANGGHIGLSHIYLHWYYWGSRRGFYRFRLLVGMDKHCVNEISFTNNFCFFLNLPVNNELGIVQDGRHEFIIKCFKPSQNH